MKRVSLLLMLAAISRLTAHAQAYESRLEYQKTQQPVAVIELPYNQDVVEDGIKDYMAKKGVKGSGSRGFTVFRALKLDENDANLCDLYFKIEHKSRKEKDVTVVTLLPTKTNQDILARSLTDSTRIDAAKAFLNAMTPSLDAHNVDVAGYRATG